jgi:hypothetical protein
MIYHQDASLLYVVVGVKPRFLFAPLPFFGRRGGIQKPEAEPEGLVYFVYYTKHTRVGHGWRKSDTHSSQNAVFFSPSPRSQKGSARFPLP